MGSVPVLTALAFATTLLAADRPKPVGTQGVVGTLANPQTVARLEITKPGVYENFLVDAQGAGGIGTGSHHAAFFGASTHGKRFAMQGWVVQFFHRAEEGVQVEVQDGAHGGILQRI